MPTPSETENRETEKSERAGSAPERREAAGCCGGAAPTGADACCALDAEVKSAGGSGCGCGPQATAARLAPRRCC